MIAVITVIHLLIVLALIGVVLMQRSEGGALGIGGGGGGLVSQRGAATALSKVTWALAIGFLTTSIMLTILASSGNTGSVLDTVPGGSGGGGSAPASDLPLLPLPPQGGSDSSAIPPAPATPPASQ
jgi:preprotein translocase subunit SecG